MVKKATFSSRWGLILSVLGIAVGTGNIWRFPRIAATNASEEGAATFLITWIIFLFIWSIPLIIAEYALGKKTRLSPVGSFAEIAGKSFTWMGAFVAFVATAIMFYYSVVAGWCIHYFIETLINPLPFSKDAAMTVWDSFQGSGYPILFHGLAMGLGGWACWKGITSIERVNKILVPTLLIVVIIAVIRAITLPGAWAGISYLFTPDWSQLTDVNIWLQALTQNAWDTGAGWGLILAYAVYMRHSDGTVKNAFITGLGNNMVSLLAAIMIFGTVFSILGAKMPQEEVLSIMKDSGPASTGLTFIWMPQLFGQMAFGKILAILFFIGLSFAAFSSLISMIQLSSQVLTDWGIDLKKAVLTVTSVGFILGLPSAMSADFLGNQDFVWGVALMISGAFFSFVIIKYGTQKFIDDAVNVAPDDWKVGKIWKFIIQFVVPFEAIILLGWWMYLAATSYAPDAWFDPFNPYSVMTCLVQWGVAIVVFLVFNKWMYQRIIENKTQEA